MKWLKTLFKRNVDKEGNSPLHLAASNGDMSEAARLISEGDNVNAKNINGWTPLHLAALGGHESVAQLLITSGAKVNATNRYKATPLHQAYYGHHYAVIRLLVSKGANEEVVDIYGQIPKRSFSGPISYTSEVEKKPIRDIERTSSPTEAMAQSTLLSIYVIAGCAGCTGWSNPVTIQLARKDRSSSSNLCFWHGKYICSLCNSTLELQGSSQNGSGVEEMSSISWFLRYKDGSTGIWDTRHCKHCNAQWSVNVFTYRDGSEHGQCMSCKRHLK